MIPVLGTLMRLCRPKICLFAQFNKNISRHLYERGKAEENIHFLKLQREQLKSLRQKILSQKKMVNSKLNQVDEKISTLEKSDAKRKEN
ncbi:uncharacterized protein Dana_GF11834, isoform C [Drosophila ananassae]|uniref:Uncharacterized protein, isoform B n=1 Tax=Drosophila ananassae TaxID=7217 RepID=A0A0P8ZNV9_DROAN|nr:uncharacterized protein LOC6494696 [Drosophila ananassae]KPU76333.1 uncharacterized protein Dana_GF11834, isoform B [Drosophila ananassae]KPU76334.1 uncharacterized protein Dana_GF11834, isoform C [Drosophila ananassae]